MCVYHQDGTEKLLEEVTVNVVCVHTVYPGNPLSVSVCPVSSYDSYAQ